MLLSPSSDERRDDTGELLSPLQREFRSKAEKAESAIFWLCAVFGYVGVMLETIRYFCKGTCKSRLHYQFLLDRDGDKGGEWRWFVRDSLLYFTMPSAIVLVLLLIWALARRRTLKLWMLIRAIRRVEDWTDIPQVVKSLSGLVFVAAALASVVSVPFAIMMVEAAEDTEYHQGLDGSGSSGGVTRSPPRIETTMEYSDCLPC